MIKFIRLNLVVVADALNNESVISRLWVGDTLDEYMVSEQHSPKSHSNTSAVLCLLSEGAPNSAICERRRQLESARSRFTPKAATRCSCQSTEGKQEEGGMSGRKQIMHNRTIPIRTISGSGSSQ